MIATKVQEQLEQEPLFELIAIPENYHEWGTFKDSIRAPIHNWFTYPAGFSYKAVESNLNTHRISSNSGKIVYDPFMGSGTTNVTAKKLGIESYGVEAHPFVFNIARAKLAWEIQRGDIVQMLGKIQQNVKRQRVSRSDSSERMAEEFPELILKCYENQTLFDLFLIRDSLATIETNELRSFFTVALTSILRQVSLAATGWPYIAPKKLKTSSLGKDALSEFARQVSRMIDDIEVTKKEAVTGYLSAHHHIFNDDSRNTQHLISNNTVDHVFTSPPYLNNFDYADRTRLELYFFGEAKTWGDITKKIRTKLITSATTQIARDDPRYIPSKILEKLCPDVYEFISTATAKLGELRLNKGGKKSYDHLVSGYFNDMLLILSDVFRVLRPGGKAVFVLGDSAPYGVHVPTDELIGKIGMGVGFDNYELEPLRTRGGKWKDNPQRHDVLLRESIVTLTKA